MTQIHEAELSASEANGLEVLKGLYGFLREKAGELEAHQAEKDILDRVLAIGLEAMRAYFEAKGTGDVGSKLVDEEGREYRRLSPIQTKSYISLFGKVKVPRTGYHAAGRAILFPLDAEANLPRRRFSYPLQELVNDFGMNGPFRDAMDRLKKWRHDGVWDHSAEQICRESAEDYGSYYEAKPAPDPAPPEVYLIASIDGKGVPMIKAEAAKIQGKRNKGEKRQKKKEALVGVCYTVGPKVRTAEDVAENLIYPERARERRQAQKLAGEEEEPKPRDVRRLASLRPKEEVMGELLREAEQRDPNHERGLGLLMDGDRGLERLALKTFAAWPRAQVHLILDIIHVKDYLWNVAHALYREGSDAAAAYVYKQLVKILQGNVGLVIGAFKSSLTKRRLRGGKAKAVSDAIRYFKNHRHMMKYDVHLAWGFPIATGMVESACKSLVKNRMEGCGMRWSIAGAEGMLRLRSLHLSGDWDAYWKFRIAQERERRHGATLRILPRRGERRDIRRAG